MNNDMDDASVVPRSLPYHMLEEMTDGFSEEREIGSGTYGKVYLGVNKDGEKIAVKVLYNMPSLEDNDKQFDKEFHNLTCLHHPNNHPNIVRFIGYCHETRRECNTYDGRLVLAEVTKRALCFEYMHNGSLDSYLNDESKGHDWHTCYTIIKGICMGLRYLHMELQPSIFHLDLKPANVLLDENMVPRIEDFGLSRLFGEERTQTTQSSIGTIGYIPPEFINQSVISNKFDIFSLGVVIIKMMAGPMGYSQSAEMSSQEFIEHVRGNWKNKLPATTVDLLELYCRQVKRCIEIALTCVEFNRHERPTIGEIVDELNKIDTVSQFPDALRNDPGSLMDQGSRQTHITEVEENQGNREREGVRAANNLFGEVVDNYKLDKMSRYMGTRKTREDRVREACYLIEEDGKDVKASRYAKSLKAMYGNAKSTTCLIYNATGDTLYHITDHEWYGQIGRAPYPTEIGNSQWAAFHHVQKIAKPSGSVAAVVYRGKNTEGQSQDYLVAWYTPRGLWCCNKSYCEIGGVDYFQTRWYNIYNKLINANYQSEARSDGCSIEAENDKGYSPRFIARITSPEGHLQHWHRSTCYYLINGR